MSKKERHFFRINYNEYIETEKLIIISTDYE